MIFSYFTSVASQPQICRKSDFERIINSPAVKKIVNDYRDGSNPNAKKNLPAFCFVASFPQGKRKASEALASGCGMIDLDHVPSARLDELLAKVIPSAEAAATSPVLLVHVTPSGHGLRVVFKLTKEGIFATCQSMRDYQHTFASALGAEDLLDDVVVDLARLSFAVPAEDIKYFSERLFTDTAEVTELAASVPQAAPLQPTLPILPVSNQQEYDGVSLSLIFEQYFSITGGLPQQGARNSRFYAAARDLRYICDFAPNVLADYLPDVGLPAAEVFQLCVSACQSSRATSIPQDVIRAVEMAKDAQEADFGMDSEDADNEWMLDDETDDPYASLPHVAREFVSAAPYDFKEATLLSLLPIVGTLATHVRAPYLDGELHSPSFITIVTSEQASGKSFARRLVRVLMQSIEQEDAAERELEQKYKEELKAKKNAKSQPELPRTKIRIVPASISVAKLLQRVDFAGGEHLFSFDEEMDTLIKSNKAGAWSEKNDIYRKAFDNATYGQDFMSDNSYSANLPIFYNLLVLGTPRQTDRFFRDVENGLPSRCCFAFLPDQFGATMPHFKPLSETTLLHIERLVSKLRAAGGQYDLSFVFPVLSDFLEEHRKKALEENNRARDIFRRRSAVIGFRAAMAFAPLYNLRNKRHREKLSQFAFFIASLALQNQMRYAGDRLNEIINQGSRIERRGNKESIYDAIPDLFTANDVALELKKRGMTSPARSLIYAWKKAGMITKFEKKYIKNGIDSKEKSDKSQPHD